MIVPRFFTYVGRTETRYTAGFLSLTVPTHASSDNDAASLGRRALRCEPGRARLPGARSRFTDRS